MTEIREEPKLRYAALFFFFVKSLLAGTSPQRYHTGSEIDVATEAVFGALLMGGGTEPDDAIRWLLKRADGGDVVVLRASGADGYNDYFFSEIGGVNSVRTFVFDSREQSFDDSMLDALEAAELIFLAGGDQSKYLKYWKGTPVQTLINQHLARGKPIGGTSAGLAVLGDTVYAAYKGSIQSREALKDPFHEDLTLDSGFLRVPYLQNVVTDSHFGERGRLGRLVAFQARGIQLRGKDLVGIGVDEETALAIDREGQSKVFSRKPFGRVYLSVFNDRNKLKLAKGDQLSTGVISVVGLGKESSVNLTNFNVSNPVVFSTMQVIDGKLKEVKTGPEETK